MIGWIQLIIGTLTLAREIVKYLNQIEQNKRESNLKIKQMRTALKLARKKGSTNEIENLFAAVGITVNDKYDKQL